MNSATLVDLCGHGTETKERENLVNAEHSEDFGPRFRPGEFHPRSLDSSGGEWLTLLGMPKQAHYSPFDRTGLFAVETS